MSGGNRPIIQGGRGCMCMVIPKPPIETLIDEVVYYPYIDVDDYGKSLFGDGITISHTRIDRTPKYTFSSSGRELVYNAVIFCYEGLTHPMPEFETRSKVVFDEVEHIITGIFPNKEPYSSQMYSVEIEVV